MLKIKDIYSLTIGPGKKPL